MLSPFSRGFHRKTGLVISIVIMTALCTLAAVVPIEAGDDRHDVQRALAIGEVVPLQQLFERIRRDFGGRVLKVELEQENHEDNLRWIYEAKILTTNGHVLELYYDAQALELLDVEGSYEYDE